MKRWLPTIVSALLVLPAFSAEKSAWPQFRGPNSSGVAEDQKPPIELGPDKNLKWKSAIPGGLSSPVAAGDKVVLTGFENNKLFTIALNKTDGKEAWRKEAPARKIEAYFKTDGSPAASSCVTDGERVVSYFGSCGLICHDLAGREIWRFEMPTAETAGDFGTGTSPILADGLIIVVRDEPKGSKIIAVDLESGSLKWEKKRLSPASYSTPIIWDTPSGKQIVSASHARLIGYDLKSGDEKWTAAGIPSGCINTPVAADGLVLFAGGMPTGPDDKEFQMPAFDDLLKQADTNKDGVISKAEATKTMLADFFDNQDSNKDGKLTRDEWNALIKFMSEGKSAALALKAGGSGELTKSHIAWRRTKGLPYITSAIAYKGQYVMIKDGGLLTAYDIKTGKEIYTQERAAAGGRYYGSPVAANGHIYFVTYEDGTVTVVKAGGETPEVAAKNPKLGEVVGATPAIADNTLYIRGAKHLWAFAEKK